MSAETTVDAVLRAIGNFDVDRLLRLFPDFVPDSVWRKGQIPGRPAESGFNQLLFEDVRPEETGGQLILALTQYRQVIQHLPVGSAQVDIGAFDVGANYGIVLDVALLAVVAELGLGLRFTSYPSTG
jgi:hypothetical protein